MSPGESILLKTYESDVNAARMAVHAAFGLPGQEVHPGRKSFEIRCLVLYGELSPHVLAQLEQQQADVLRRRVGRHEKKSRVKMWPLWSETLPPNPPEWITALDCVSDQASVDTDV